MLDPIMRVISWLEASGRVPEEAVEDIECVKENLEDSIEEFIEEAAKLSAADYATDRSLGSKLMEMRVRAQRLRNDIQSVEDALRLTLIHGIPRGTFDDKD